MAMIGYVALAYTEYNVVRVAVYLEICRLQTGPDHATSLIVNSYCAIPSMVSRVLYILQGLRRAAIAYLQHLNQLQVPGITA